MKTHPKHDVVLFIMDAPNVDMALSEILGRQPKGVDRPRFDALMVWIKLRVTGRQQLYAKVFVNQAKDHPSRAKQKRWTTVIRKFGYDVFIKNREPGNEDVDYDMIMFLRFVRMNHNLVEVIIASNDGWCFLADLEVLVQEGTRVTILGFEQFPSVLTRHPDFTFVPFPSIPGVISDPAHQAPSGSSCNE